MSDNTNFRGNLEGEDFRALDEVEGHVLARDGQPAAAEDDDVEGHLKVRDAEPSMKVRDAEPGLIRDAEPGSHKI